MSVISSHVLDSVRGTHGANIRIQCFRLYDNKRLLVFDVIANEEGRILERVDVEDEDQAAAYELVFHTAAYFNALPEVSASRQIMDEVVVRFVIPDAGERIHIPLVLSPHSYTIWWSA